MNKAVFLDKDGTLIPDIPYNVNPDLIELQENTVEGLRQLRAEGYKLIIISNQAGVAKGYFEEAEIEAVKSKVSKLLLEKGIQLDGFYYCPHSPEGHVKEYNKDCNCRKPKAGMFLKAAADFDISLSDSWMIGDILHDVEAGHRAGCRSILIDNGNETEWLINDYRRPEHLAKTINDAADYILKNITISEKQYERSIP